MDIPMALGIYWVVWWITLFAVLPIGVKSQLEEQSIIPGTAESAPHQSLIWRKLLATTLVSGLVFAFIYWLIVLSPVTLDNIPLLPKF